jgi:AbiV family abortive infection protein
MKKEGLSKYKLERLATESLRNSLRLHFDSILLFDSKSYASAFQLAVLCMEEFAKANWINDYVWKSETNGGYLNKEQEQQWLKLLYFHPDKQKNFVSRDYFSYSPKFTKRVFSNNLEQMKQNSVYVGLSKSKGKVEIDSRISTPGRIKKNDAQQIISLMNSEYLEICQRIEDDEWYFDGVSGMDQIFDYAIFTKLLNWPHKTKLKSKQWWKTNKS